MRILILTQYFPPETGAPQNRLFGLARQLRSQGAEVEILTGFPNYPAYEIQEGYRGKWYMKDQLDELVVYRTYIYVSKNKSILFRLLNYFSFVFSSLFIGIFKTGKYDLIVCESPPLFLGFTAVLLKWWKRSKLVFNVSDLWPESAVKLGLVTNKMIIKLSTLLEEWIYQKSDFISGQTQGIVKDIKDRFPQKPVFWLRNGIDVADMKNQLNGSNWREKVGYQSNQLVVYFGGLLGYAQGLEVILKAANLLKEYPNIQFAIVGEGPEKEKLLALKEELQVDNVTLFPGVSKAEIVNIIADIDLAIIPLRKIDLFLGAIPSKIFEILYLQKPILLGVQGEAKDLFIDEGKGGLAFEPDNENELAECVLKFYNNLDLIPNMGINGKSFVEKNFNRKQIAEDFWAFINI
jgi:glycosyltransferase involved in cell wall biosynthesis